MPRKDGKLQLIFYVDKKVYDWVVEKAEKERRKKTNVASMLIEDAYKKAKGGK